MKYIMVQLNYLRSVFDLKRLYEYYLLIIIEVKRIKRGKELKTAFKLKYKGKNIQVFIVTVRLFSMGVTCQWRKDS